MPPSAVERLAQEVVPGTGPLEVVPLDAGLVNQSFRVARDGACFTLRMTTAHPAELGLDRAWECRVLEAAAAAALGPRVERCEPHRGILVTRWVEGRPFGSAEWREPGGLEQIAALARRIHALTVPAPVRALGPAAWIAHYQEALDRLGGDAHARLRPQASERLDALAGLAKNPPVLCHGDLHAQNLIVTGRGLQLLDWEYAHVSEPLWDLAGWICNNDLDAAAALALLARYVGRAEPDARASTAARLPHLVWLYDYVCLLWSGLYARLRPQGPVEAVAARANVLVRRLQGGSR